MLSLSSAETDSRKYKTIYWHIYHPIAGHRFNQMNNHWLENLEGSIFKWFVGHLVVCRLVGNSSYVTLAFEDAQVIQPCSREKTDNTDDTDDTDDTKECKNIGM